MKHLVVYFSAAGSTRLVAVTIQRRLLEQGEESKILDLSAPYQTSEESVRWRHHPYCLWIGSPVYCDHAVPMVTDFIAKLPRTSLRSYAVPYVTWGCVTSGLALLEMATQLSEKNFVPLAAAKVLAVHSSMWRASPPLALGHPDKDDLEQIAQLVDRVIVRLQNDEVVGLDCSLSTISPQLCGQRR